MALWAAECTPWLVVPWGTWALVLSLMRIPAQSEVINEKDVRRVLNVEGVLILK